MASIPRDVKIRVKDSVSPTLQKMAENLERANKLLAENKTLLADVLVRAIEVTSDGKS